LVRFSITNCVDLEKLRVARMLSEILCQIRKHLVEHFHNLAAHGKPFPGAAELGRASIPEITPPGPITHTDHCQDAVYEYGVDGRRNGFAGLASGEGDYSKTLAQ
jgi:hypothetical protein